MDINSSAEQNLTNVLNVVDGLDMGFAQDVQNLLIPLYTSKYGEFFQQMIFDIPLANFVLAIFVFLFILLLRKFFTRIVLAFLQRLAKHSETFYDDRIISALKGPLRFGFIIIGLHFFFLLIFKETEFIKHILNTLVIYALFWAILAIIEALRELIYDVTAKFNPDLSKEMGNFILAILKIIVGGIGLAAILQTWGINVTALIASLGLGGLAFALAAKDTAANLFGSFALLADKSIRIGEWVKVGGVEGVVEDVGMRTTKIRSFQKTLITVPNQLVANQPIENFSRRGIRRIKMHIGLTYGTTSQQLIKIKSDIEAMLRSHKGISQKDSLMVFFDSFGDSSLNIFIYTFTATANWANYLEIREDIHLKTMQIVEENGSSFAFPSQSIYVEQLPPAQS
ncbi:mechanosensitive ion channel family protein [Sulfurovum sp. NBC37-1]|uniref:mechanosensitive ion channel family protein n=1 Tax=Sulfurovum sp. (strain NBC37-1) TaxID=387093 RepID=UPI0001587C92|nr:mechanosensitive ion channel family protein [Sulfurovum sp. NBC37-1]BAF72870.1 mechanosensitive ion channel MscS [Sulfurovum sp. NBC37-1]